MAAWRQAFSGCTTTMELPCRGIKNCSFLHGFQNILFHLVFGGWVAVCHLHFYNSGLWNNWWNHKNEKVVENEEVEELWDLRIETDKHLPHNTSDITIIDEKEKKAWIVDIAIPGDSRIADKGENH